MISKRKKERVDYRYAVSGLDDTIIRNLEVIHDDDGDIIYRLKNINGLHRAISHGILIQKTGISAKEIRFIRTEMGLTQEELGERLSVARGTISRWESDNAKELIDPNAEFKFRHLAAQALNIDMNLSAEDMAKRCRWRAANRPIIIDGTDPEDYQAIAA